MILPAPLQLIKGILIECPKSVAVFKLNNCWFIPHAHSTFTKPLGAAM